MATRVGPEVQWIADFLQAELNCRVRDRGWQRGNVALSQAILGSKFWALGGLNPKSKNSVLWRGSWRTNGQKMARFHRETKKEESIWSLSVTNRQTDGQTHRRTESTTKNNRLIYRLGAEINTGDSIDVQSDCYDNHRVYVMYTRWSSKQSLHDVNWVVSVYFCLSERISPYQDKSPSPHPAKSPPGQKTPGEKVPSGDIFYCRGSRQLNHSSFILLRSLILSDWTLPDIMSTQLT